MSKLASHPSKAPAVIYRYLPMRPDAIDLIRHGRLWFSSPLRFNDPFDFLPIFSHKIATVVDQSREETYWTDPSIRVSRSAFLSQTQPLRDRCIHEMCHKERTNFLKSLAKHFAVACFSEIPDSILMWSHYASFHTGLCIGIRPEKMALAPEMALRWKVQYDDERLPLEHPNLAEIALRKATVWDYEREWRVVMATSDLTSGMRPLPRHPKKPRSESGRFLKLQWDAFESVRFGALVQPRMRSAIIKDLREPPRHHIKMVQMHLADSTFALDSEYL